MKMMIEMRLALRMKTALGEKQTVGYEGGDARLEGRTE